MKLVSAKCPNCNANIEADPAKEAGICKYCHTAFITEKAINPTNVNMGQNIIQNYYGMHGANGPKIKKPMYTAEQLKQRKRICAIVFLSALAAFVIGWIFVSSGFISEFKLNLNYAYYDAYYTIGSIIAGLGFFTLIPSGVLWYLYRRDLLLENYKS